MARWPDVITPLTDEQRALVEEHLGYAYAVARKAVRPIVGSYATTEDDRQNAVLGLIDAARSWDHGSVPFTSYAYLRVRGAVIDGRRKCAMLTRTSQVTHRAFEEAWEDLAAQTEEIPTTASVLATLTWLSTRERARAERYCEGVSIIPLDPEGAIGNPSDTTRSFVTIIPSFEDEVISRLDAQGQLATCDPRDIDFIERMQVQRTGERIEARREGVSQSRISQRVRSAKNRCAARIQGELPAWQAGTNPTA